MAESLILSKSFPGRGPISEKRHSPEVGEGTGGCQKANTSLGLVLARPIRQLYQPLSPKVPVIVGVITGAVWSILMVVNRRRV